MLNFLFFFKMVSVTLSSYDAESRSCCMDGNSIPIHHRMTTAQTPDFFIFSGCVNGLGSCTAGHIQLTMNHINFCYFLQSSFTLTSLTHSHCKEMSHSAVCPLLLSTCSRRCESFSLLELDGWLETSPADLVTSQSRTNKCSSRHSKTTSIVQKQGR